MEHLNDFCDETGYLSPEARLRFMEHMKVLRIPKDDEGKRMYFSPLVKDFKEYVRLNEQIDFALKTKGAGKMGTVSLPISYNDIKPEKVS